MINRATAVPIALAAALCLTSAPTAQAAIVTSAQEPSIAEIVDRMSLREKVGQVVMFAPSGHFLTAGERDAIERHRLGGAILFARNYRDREQLGFLTSQIQRSMRRANRHKIGALISVDQEGGVVKRFGDMPPWYSAPEMGARNDTDLAFDQGRATGRALGNHGVNVDLAPVADLDLPPEHVMRSRSFGSRPWRAGRLARAFAQGMQRKGVAATLKHFPGLGGATVNSDHGRAYVRRTRKQLREIDAVPFRRAIGGRAKLVMMSHAIYTNLKGRRPASLNRNIADHLLRDRFDFTGVAISDALEPVSWWFGGDVARTCKATIRAGVDIALLSGEIQTGVACARKIRDAVRNGTIREGRLDEAVTRVLKLKKWLGVFTP